MEKKIFTTKKKSEEELKGIKEHEEERKRQFELKKIRFFETIGRLLPAGLTKKAGELLVYAGRIEHAESWMGSRFLNSVTAGVLIFITLHFLKPVNLLISAAFGAVSFIIVLSAYFASLSIIADTRAREIERLLPSALELISANVRAGMTPDRAIWLSARPEFGVLEEEIKRIGSDIVGGTQLSDAFLAMTKRVRSRTLERTIKLIVEGMNSGGELAKLLDGTASEIKAIELLRKEMNSNVAMYTMFIIFASLIGMPFLLSISTFFVEMISKLSELSGIGNVAEQAESQGVSLLSFSTTVTPGFLQTFSVIAILITTFFGALLIGIIRSGDEKKGLELAPIFVVFGLVVFFALRLVLSSVFGSIIGA